MKKGQYKGVLLFFLILFIITGCIPEIELEENMDERTLLSEWYGDFSPDLPLSQISKALTRADLNGYINYIKIYSDGTVTSNWDVSSNNFQLIGSGSYEWDDIDFSCDFTGSVTIPDFPSSQFTLHCEGVLDTGENYGSGSFVLTFSDPDLSDYNSSGIWNLYPVINGDDIIPQ